MAKKGTALAGMMQAEFVDKCPNPQLIPPNLRLCYRQHAEMNAATFKAAEALGWQPTSRNIAQDWLSEKICEKRAFCVYSS